MDDRVFLALDLGTSSFRASLYRPSGQAIRGSIRSEGLTVIGPGVLDPAAAADVVERLIDSICPLASRIDVVAVSCFWHSLLGVNRAGAPMTPVYLWSDLRSSPDAQALREALDARGARPNRCPNAPHILAG